ncbi:uncharacterized protein [Pyrus communis]|uniref:uncharacterized protein n=1 Tax=Pyrus communis TaxID=23211 RepID=UPI0035C0F375
MTHANLMNNYFNPNSVYTEDDFRHRFWMRRYVFEHKLDKTGHPDFSPHQKVIVALRMMAYGSPVDSMDETHGMTESTCLDTLVEFCNTIVQFYKEEYLCFYKEEYLCEPNQEDLDRLIRKDEDRGFPGMIGSLDCIHWNWKNYPTGWQ